MRDAWGVCRGGGAVSIQVHVSAKCVPERNGIRGVKGTLWVLHGQLFKHVLQTVPYLNPLQRLPGNLNRWNPLGPSPEMHIAG